MQLYIVFEMRMYPFTFRYPHPYSHSLHVIFRFQLDRMTLAGSEELSSDISSLQARNDLYRLLCPPVHPA